MAAAMACCALAPGAGGAQQAAPAPLPAGQPVTLTADQVSNDAELDIVIATGNVELTQGARILRADAITYNRRTRLVTASGNIVLLEPSGDVVFASYAELDDQLRDGFVQGVGIRLTDQSRIAATVAERRDGTITEGRRAVFTPCNTCTIGDERTPIWQIRADRVTHDSEADTVTYRNAILDFFGVPVLYTPFLQHPDPTVTRKSGFLPPVFGSGSEVGPFAEASYYWSIAPSLDATGRLRVTSASGVLAGAEYRQRFQRGLLVLDGDINQSERPELSAPGGDTEDIRYRIDGTFAYDVNRHVRGGANLRRTSDDTFLDTFDISNDDVLRSRAFVEAFDGLSHASAEVFSFQDLRLIGINQPLILPWLQTSLVSDAGTTFGGTVSLDSSFLSLIRDDAAPMPLTVLEGVDTFRLSSRLAWDRETITDLGVIAAVHTSVRADGYLSQDLPLEGDITGVGPATTDEELGGRIFPAGGVTLRYPLARRAGRVQQVIEPVVALTGTLDLDDGVIPDNDSLNSEFDTANLFRANRFLGLDEVEDGARVTYGANLGYYGDGGGFTSLFAGQTFQINDLDIDEEVTASGIEDDLSDIVGRLVLAPSAGYGLTWRFRFDDDEFRSIRQDVGGFFSTPFGTLSASYTFFDGAALSETAEDREEVFGFVSGPLTGRWDWQASARYDLIDDEARNVSVGLGYRCDCLTFTIQVEQDFTSDRDLEEGLNVLVTLNLRHLGGF